MSSTVDFTKLVSDRIKMVQGGEREELLKMSEGMPDLIKLGRGDPDLDTPEHIRDAAIASLKAGHTHYTHWAGKIELRRLIAEKLKRDNQLEYDPETEIIVTTGAQQGMMATMLALLDPGDEVIMGDPYYTSYSECVQIAGGKAVLVPTKEENDFVLTADEIRAAITDKTKIIVIVSPNNPTGTLTPAEELKKIADLAIEKNLLVISDEIYEKVRFENFTHTSLASFPGMKERSIVLNGFSKAYSMTGWRIGYMAAPAALVGQMECLIHDMTISVAEFVQDAAIVALESGDDCIRKTVAIYDERRRALMEAFDAVGLKYTYPKAGLYMWLNIQSTGLSSFDFCKKLLLEGHVQLFPGTVYGHGEGYIRVSLLAPTDQLKEAAQRMVKVFGIK